MNDTPPINNAICNLRNLFIKLNSSATCIANSLVGAKISDLGILDFDFPELNISAKGIMNEPVLPVPVCAQPNKSLPVKIWGIALL